MNFPTRILVPLLFLFSCSNLDNRSNIKHIEERISEIDETILTNRAIILIPNSGCTGCISSAEQFIVDFNDDLKDVKVIFTGINSMKTLRVRIGDKINDRNIHLDLENEFYFSELITLYPVVIFTKNNLISSIFEQRPENSFSIDSVLISRN
ncbi:hypothetical protein [uncultured Roseivirga sp.]|uniref:hypothetical protein n=1 Tax=uncultured Roseivirga sp. TaxID=543088 RepID=UPI0030D9CD4D